MAYGGGQQRQAQSAPSGGLNLSGMFGSGSELAGSAPPGWGAFGGVPFINPTYVDPSQLPGALQMYEGLNAASLQPEFTQQSDDLNQSLASRGIYSSGAAQDAAGTLQSNQNATLAGMNAPLIQTFAGFQQQDALANAQSANAASGANAAAYGGAVGADMNSYDQWIQSMLGYGAGVGQSELSGLFGSYTPNPGYGSAYSNGQAGAGSLGAGLGGALGGLFGQGGPWGPKAPGGYTGSPWGAGGPPV